MSESPEQRAARRTAERTRRKEAADQAIRVLTKDSDRSVALVGAALIDAELEDALLRFIYPTSDAEDAARKVFGSHGSMSSFSAKIDLGLMLGIYGGAIASDLHTIRKIRNEFAHNLDAHDFQSVKVAAQTTRLEHMLHFIVSDGDQKQLQQPYPGGGVFVANLTDDDLTGRRFFLQCVIFYWGALWSAAPLAPHPVLNWKPPLPSSA